MVLVLHCVRCKTDILNKVLQTFEKSLEIDQSDDPIILEYYLRQGSIIVLHTHCAIAKLLLIIIC